MATCSPVRFIQPAPTDTPASLGVEPGWYVRHACCSIWFEVLSVHGDWVSCVSRDPKRVKSLGSIGENYSSVNEFCTARPVGLRWIASDRTKSFYDKFFPELDKIQRRPEGVTMSKERFEIRKSESIKKPWLVEDTHSERAEDPVIYHFTSKKKAEAFKTMLVAEQAN